ncbi:hypothetical protein [Pedobacter frigiditerrae]|uniref:hypothetical protein n=1 Tax=Pedobacter frigiditerrae TaxID=2530452 RepID=UPI00292FD1DE|nr:hypothetical protein [Pedobacter frigiditerrae]
MNIKPIKIYFFLLLAIIGAYSFATWSGYAFYNDKVEKNTEYNGAKGRSGYVNRFYHK